MALLVPVPGATTTQPFGIAVPSVAALEPAMWGTNEMAHGLRFPGATFHEHFHSGIDRAAVQDTPILAIQSGTVVFSGFRNRVSGNVVRVEIRPGSLYGFSHCSKLLVGVGVHVEQGETIALIGKSGLATGFHTHSFVSLRHDAGDGRTRDFLFDPTLFEPGGRLADDPRVAPLPSGPPRLVTLKGPGINIRTEPDLAGGASTVFATSRPDGIFRRGIRIHPNVFTGFTFLRELTNDDGDWVEVFGFNRVLYIHRTLVTIS